MVAETLPPFSEQAFRQANEEVARLVLGAVGVILTPEFDNFLAKGERVGSPRTPEELKKHAEWINTITGRGNIGEGGVGVDRRA